MKHLKDFTKSQKIRKVCWKRLGHVQIILERNVSYDCVSQGKEIIFCSVNIRPKIGCIWINNSLNLKIMSRLLKLNFSSHPATYHGYCLLTFLSHWWYLRRVCVYVGMNMYVYMIRKQRIYPFDLRYFFCIFIS